MPAGYDFGTCTVTLPNGMQVAVEVDATETSARWRTHEYGAWHPVDKDMVVTSDAWEDILASSRLGGQRPDEAQYRAKEDRKTVLEMDLP